ncbi:hypothetical protein AB7X11_13500 [Providencia alcalifaciens]
MLSDMFNSFYTNEYSNWAFSGIGLTAMAFIVWFLKKIFKRPDSDIGGTMKNENNNAVVTINNFPNGQQEKNESISNEKDISIEEVQKKTHILFIDDKKFLVTDILISSGWNNTKSLKDVTSINQREIRDADIIFVDIQGVGIKMKFAEEGLGLAKALKEKYPKKNIIVYSAEQTGNRFHETLKIVDDFLPKDADPYLFEEIIERFSMVK